MSSKCNHDIFITFSQRCCSKIKRKTNIRKYEFLNAIHFSASPYKLLYGCFQNMRRPKTALYSIYVIGLLNNNHKKEKLHLKRAPFIFLLTFWETRLNAKSI